MVRQAANEQAPAGGHVVEGPDGLRTLSTPHAQAFLGLVRAADELVQHLEADLQSAHRISLRAFEVLLHLAVFAPDRRLRVTQLAKQAPLSQSRVSRLVAQLEQDGLVTRSTSDGDGRGVEVSLTERGLAKFAEAQETHLAGLDQLLFSHLSEEEIGQLASITGKITQAIR